MASLASLSRSAPPSTRSGTSQQCSKLGGASWTSLLLLLTNFVGTHGFADLIIDTDMSVDVDDVGMLCAAHALVERGEANILAVVHDTGLPSGVGAIAAINEFWRRGNIMIGGYHGELGSPGASYEP